MTFMTSSIGGAGPIVPIEGSAGSPRGIYGGEPGAFELTAREYWPTTLFTRMYRDQGRDGPSIVAHLQELKARQTANIASGVAPVMKSKDGLYESTFDLFETTAHDGLKRLIAFIRSSLSRAVWHVNGRQHDLKRIRVRFLDSWFHITNGRGFHDAHYHGGCSWCGVYYLQASDIPARQPEHAPNGVNRFYAPWGSGGKYGDYGTHYLGVRHVDFPPVPGLLVLFPSYLLHSGLPYEGEKDRVILSFNAAADLLPDGEAPEGA